jgi:protein involved in polysaccharide export with SLBB domain
MKKLFIIMLITSFFASGCASTFVLTKRNTDYKIRVGDQLRIVIWKELDEKVIVRPDHKISLPLIGEVSCKDKTPEELSKELTEKYEAKTTVIVAKYHTLKDDLKEIISIIRDIAVTYFIGERIINRR